MQAYRDFVFNVTETYLTWNYLPELQHYGAATCLIDFTENAIGCPLVCLFGRTR